MKNRMRFLDDWEILRLSTLQNMSDVIDGKVELKPEVEGCDGTTKPVTFVPEVPAPCKPGAAGGMNPTPLAATGATADPAAAAPRDLPRPLERRKLGCCLLPLISLSLFL
eukprot:TRINITY_DN3345_c0_g1_i2.p2 TRINITY_DN3345_c0_g1~~TRINITY_DN3345_c0_g1_i2.p2  ORF type:complete len:110 (-),score=11.37 TRINITY_DN3345_c0_g1_i2:221-550(-)